MEVLLRVYKNQFVRNFGVNGLNFIVKIGLGLLLPPLLIKLIGLSSLGYVQIATSVAAYSALLSTSLNQANNKFVTVGIGSNNQPYVNNVLSTIFTMYGVSFLLVIPLLLLFLLNVDVFVDVDTNDINSIRLLFLFVGLSQICVMSNTALASPLYAKNRIDLIQGVNVTRNILRLIFIFFGLSYVVPNIVAVGVAIFTSSLISTIISIYYFRDSLPSFSFTKFSSSILSDVMKLSGWTCVSVLGVMFFMQTDILLINRFLGSETSGEFALLNQWVVLLISLTAVLSGSLAPKIMMEYSKGNIDKMKILFLSSIKHQGIFIAIPISIIFVFADFILKIWVGEDFVYLSNYLRLIIVLLSISMAMRQVATINTIFDKMKGHALLTLFFSLCHIVAVIFLLKYTTFGMVGVIISNVLFFFLLNVVFLPLYANKKLKISKRKIYKHLFLILLFEISLIAIGFTLRYLSGGESYISALLIVLFLLFVSLVGIYFFIADQSERKLLKNYLGGIK